MVNGVELTTYAGSDGRFCLTVALAPGQNQLYVKAGALISPATTVTYVPGRLSDVAGHWAADAVGRMVDLGVVSGYEDATFRPENQVTRLEFAVMLARLLKLPAASAPLRFTDSDRIPAWAQAQLAAAVQAGIVQGLDDGSFAPDTPVTRAQAAVMLVRALKFKGLDITPGSGGFPDAIPAWAADQVVTAARYGLVHGYPDGTFRAGNTATRAEAVTMLARLLDVLSR